MTFLVFQGWRPLRDTFARDPFRSTIAEGSGALVTPPHPTTRPDPERTGEGGLGRESGGVDGYVVDLDESVGRERVLGGVVVVQEAGFFGHRGFFSTTSIGQDAPLRGNNVLVQRQGSYIHVIVPHVIGKKAPSKHKIPLLQVNDPQGFRIISHDSNTAQQRHRLERTIQ